MYLFLERGREGEREGEKYQCVGASHMPPAGDLAHNPDIKTTTLWLAGCCWEPSCLVSEAGTSVAKLSKETLGP